MPRRDEPYLQPLIDDWATPLMAGWIEDEEEYWEYIRHITDVGLYQSMRIFITTGENNMPVNADSVAQAANDIARGWSDIFSPRTLMTTDGSITLGQKLPMMWFPRSWNDIDGTKDNICMTRQSMTRDPGTTIHPSTGKPMGMRSEFVADAELADIFNARYGADISPGEYMLQKDCEFDAYGSLVKNLDVPTGGDVWFYDVQREEWINGAHTYDPVTRELVSVDKVATAVTYRGCCINEMQNRIST